MEKGLFCCERSVFEYRNIDLSAPRPGDRGEFTAGVSLGSVLNHCRF